VHREAEQIGIKPKAINHQKQSIYRLITSYFEVTCIVLFSRLNPSLIRSMTFNVLTGITLLLIQTVYASVGSSVTSPIIFGSSQLKRRRSSSAFLTTRDRSSTFSRRSSGLSFLGENDIRETQNCRSIGNTLLRGALLRIASDLSGGTPLESIKTRVTITEENMMQATQSIVEKGGILALWKGTPSRTVEGALIGAVFMLGSVLTKAQLKKIGAPPTIAALAGGLVGGVAQAAIMTPAGMIFTSLNAAESKETTLGVIRRVVSEKGIGGMWIGSGSMCIRQATNWASRAGFTEIARSQLKLTQYGLWGELASGAIGGVGSCWNTPIETIRVITQRDVAQGKKPESIGECYNRILNEQGVQGLFRGVTPRAIQAVWQTVFLVVVPNLMGI
jgi:hypothetical protein